MSISSLTNAAVARRPDFEPAGTPNTYAEIAKAAGLMVAAIPKILHGGATIEEGKPPAPGTPEAQPEQQGAGPVSTALNVLFGYIPTEVLTLYVAVLAALTSLHADWIAFYIFLVVTPLVVWLVYGAKLKNAGKGIPWRFATWPVWEMFAATVAYAAWAFALPNSPFTSYTNWYSSGLAGITVLVASTFLGLMAPFFQGQLGM